MGKKNSMIGSVVFLIMLLIAGTTFAWFIASTAPVTNKFKAGTLEMELKDIFVVCNAGNVNPGDTIDKVVYVKNKGTKRMFVRVLFTPAFSDPLLSTSVVSYPILNGWKLHTDGYYYYPHEILPGSMTPILIEEVKFDGPAMGNDYQGVKFTLTVQSDAIQATNGAAADVWGIHPPDLL